MKPPGRRLTSNQRRLLTFLASLAPNEWTDTMTCHAHGGHGTTLHALKKTGDVEEEDTVLIILGRDVFTVPQYPRVRITMAGRERIAIVESS